MKSCIAPLAIALVSLLSSCGQNVNTFAKYISAEGLKQHLVVLASDSMQGREMATEGERKASTFISSEFQRIGLHQVPGLNGYLQPFSVVRDSAYSSSISLTGNAYPLDAYGVNYNLADSVLDVHSDNIIFVGYGIDEKNYSDYESVNATGSIVACYLGEPRIDSDHYVISGTSKRSDWSSSPAVLTKRLAAAQKHGAKSLVILYEELDTLPGLKSRLGRNSQFHLEPAKRGAAAISSVSVTRPLVKQILGQDYERVSQSFENRSPMESFVIHTPISITMHKKTIRKQVNNVIGYVEGTDKKDEFVIVSAHYDHLGTHNGEIFHGADDNGSGTCGVLGIAEAFAKAAQAGMRPRRSIVFLSVTGEEKGLFGSKNYVAHPAFPLDQTVVDLNTDMIGRTDFDHLDKDSNYIYVIGDEKLSSELRGINERNNNDHTKLNLDYKYNDPNDPNRFYYRSDHYEFAQKNIPIIFYFDGVHKDYHQPSDTVDKINFEIMEKRARLAYYTAWEIANREVRLKVDRSAE